MKISSETKEAIVKKALTAGGNLKLIAEQNNVGYSSLSKWLSQYRAGTLGQGIKGNSKAKQCSPAERFEHILSTSSLDEEAVGVYCRERGLYSTQLLKWKEDMMAGHDDKKQKTLLIENHGLRIEIKELKRDLLLKTNALAETAALLVLKKKAYAIWGDHEDV